MKGLAIVLIFLGGCAGVAMSVETLREQGYQRIRTMFVTATGELRESDLHELWVKESRDEGRRAHYCLVPKTAAGYNWRITVYVDDKETWEYESGPLSGRPSVRMGIDCTVSPPLPEGRLSTFTNFAYWH